MVISRLSSKKTDYESILPFRLLRDRCYRADCSIIIHKPMCETPASVLSPVDTTIISDILQFSKLTIVVTEFTVYNSTSHNA